MGKIIKQGKKKKKKGQETTTLIFAYAIIYRKDSEDSIKLLEI